LVQMDSPNINMAAQFTGLVQMDSPNINMVAQFTGLIHTLQ
jgi:hypothetical protein